MTVMDPRAASTDAASLSGLSVRAEAGLAAAGGQLRRALHALDAAAQGATDRALLNTFPRWRHRVTNAPVSEGARTLVLVFSPFSLSLPSSVASVKAVTCLLRLSHVTRWDRCV